MWQMLCNRAGLLCSFISRGPISFITNQENIGGLDSLLKERLQFLFT